MGLKDREVVVVGAGPAGISAAVYARRGGARATVIGRDGGALEKTDAIENYYGFPEAVSGRELFERGISQAKRLGVDVVADEVVGIGYGNRLLVKTASRAYEADALILATGVARRAPGIPGLREFEGRGVSYCAACDAFFFRDRDVAVLGCCEYALHEAEELLPIARSVTLVTNGEPPTDGIPIGLRVVSKKIDRFEGSDRLRAVRFADGGELAVAGVFVAVGVAGSGDLARKLGAQTDQNRIVVDERMATNVPGVFAAGDCTGGVLQIHKAVHEGSLAGAEAVRYLRGLE